MKKCLIILLAVLFLTSVVAAESRRGGFQVGIAFEPFFPQGEFREVSDNIGWGGSLDMLYRISNSALHIGAAFAYHVNGSETRWEPLSWSIPDILIKVRTTNAVIRGHMLLRLQPAFGRLRPYIEGLIGLQHLTTDTGAYDDSDWEEEAFASTNHIRSTVFSYGMGGGLLLNLMGRPRSQEHNPFAVDLEFGLRYLRGGTAEYLTPGDIELADTSILYYVNQSRTDMLIPKVGLAFSF
jgi:opacity protein-like surface antigen